MKKYLLMALLASLSVQAENNPFALKENLQKIDKDQDVLLSALKEISDDQEAKEDAALDAQEVNEAPVAEVNTEEPQVEEEIAVDKEQAMKNEADSKAEEMAQQKKEEAKLAKIKEEQAKIEAQRKQELAVQKREQEKKEVEAYEAKRLEKENKMQKLPERLQHYKDIVNAKVEKKGEALKGKTKNILESLLKEKNNPNFSLNEAKKIIDGNKDVGMAIVAYMMGKSLVYYNQLTPKEKSDFDKKSMERMQEGKGKSEADEFAMYAEKYPEEVKKIAFSFLEDILENGIPEVNFNMQLSGNFSINSEDSESFTMGTNTSTQQMNSVNNMHRSEAIADINITREQMIAKKEADKAYLDAVAEMDVED